MKRLFVITVAALILAGCGTSLHFKKTSNPYVKPLFYSRYLNPANPLDQQIQATVDALRANPRDAALHNALGQLLAQKGFPKDAETEFERAIDADRHFYAGWFNLGILRSARGDFVGARIAFNRTIRYKPGHSEALFQLALVEEKRGNEEDAIAYMAKAFSINRSLLDVRVNPQILDTKLTAVALIRAYPNEHNRQALLFQPTPAGYGQKGISAAPDAASPVVPTGKIVPPAAPNAPPH
jgi:tetratricopeptide (TPR) repeat protein